MPSPNEHLVVVKSAFVGDMVKAEANSLENFEYLIHHIENNEGEEVIHHCRLYDHLGNMFTQGHVVIKNGAVTVDGKKVTEGTFHVITGLEPTQEVCWSDEEALDADITPKEMVDGMTKKEKAKIW